MFTDTNHHHHYSSLFVSFPPFSCPPAGADALSDEERGDSVIDSLLGEDEAEDAADDVQDAAAKEGEGAKKEDL